MPHGTGAGPAVQTEVERVDQWSDREDDEEDVEGRDEDVRHNLALGTAPPGAQAPVLGDWAAVLLKLACRQEYLLQIIVLGSALVAFRGLTAQFLNAAQTFGLAGQPMAAPYSLPQTVIPTRRNMVSVGATLWTLLKITISEPSLCPCHIQIKAIMIHSGSLSSPSLMLRGGGRGVG